MGVCGGTAPTPPGGQRPPLRKGAPSRGPGQLHLGPRAAAVRRLASKCTCGCDLGPLGRFTFSRPTGGERRAAVQAPLKRGLSPPPGGDWGFLVSCRGRGAGRGKKPSVTASPCHLPFQGRFWRADIVRPYEWREVAGNCMFPSIYSQKLSPAAQKSGQGVSHDTPCPFFAF